MSKPIEIDLTNQGDRPEGGALPSARAASLRPQPPTASSQSGIPNAADYRLIVARWKGRENLLEEFCNARAAAGSGRVAKTRLSAEYPVRYWPRLARRNVSIDQPSSLYATRAEALKAATEYRSRCRLIRAAMVFFRELDALAASGIEVAAASETRSGSTEGESPAPKGGDAQ